ncbi:MAG: GNAT family N-acetyltransferase [Pseudomonadota bacterium]|nr:GNAT family N-acetyltransferase [Pseudomonadota bacterium]
MTITYEDGTLADVAAIDRIFRESFCETFAHLYSEADLRSFLGQFTPQAWAEEVGSSDYAFRLAEAHGQTVGFAKIGPSTLPVEQTGPSVELRQLYVLKTWHGSGISRVLMDWALAEARRRGVRELLLTVYTDNHRAKRFYQRYGFEEVGPYAFMVGSQADEDIIMRLRL